MARLDPLKENFGDQFAAEDPLARYTVARLGGPAEGVLRVKSRDELLWAARWVHKEKIPWFILGGGASKKPDKWVHRLDPGCDIAIATMANDAGIAGAALLAPDGSPSARE